MKISASITVPLFFAIVALAQDLETDPCQNDPTGYCMNMMAIKYTNQYRSAPLVSGSISMFDNAMKHSIDQDKKGDIFHQPLQNGIIVGSGQCETTLSGENVAYFMNPRIKNAALYCVSDLWKNSEGHFQNMINPSFKSVVVAIYRNNGRITCTQTFSREVPEGEGQCSAALPISANQNSQSEMPAESATPPQSEIPSEEESPKVEDIPLATGGEPKINEASDTVQDPSTMKVEPSMEEKVPDSQLTEENEMKMGQQAEMIEEEIPGPMKNEQTRDSKETFSGKEKMVDMNPKQKYSLKLKSITITTAKGSEISLMQKCFFRRCYYCIESSNRCYGHRASRKLDRIFGLLSL